MDAVVLWLTHTASVALTGGGGAIDVRQDNEAILLAITPVIVIDGGGVSGPDTYAWAADQ